MHSTEAITLVVVVGVALALAAHPPVVDAGSSASAAPAPVPLPQLRGVNIHYTHGRPGETAQLAEAFDAARMDFNWASIEKVKGVYNFSAYDVLVDDLTSNGMVPYLILDYANPLYDGGLEPDDAAGRAAFAAYAVAGVKRYAGKGVIWEVQNEPNGGFWKPHPNATAYGLLALATAQAIKAAAPGEIVVAPTTSGIDLGYMQTAFATGVLEWLDGVSCHPYRDVAPETVLNASGSNYPALKALVAGTTQRALPIVSGEWGYTTCSPPSPTCAGAGPLDEATQARYLARRWLAVRRAPALQGPPRAFQLPTHSVARMRSCRNRTPLRACPCPFGTTPTTTGPTSRSGSRGSGPCATGRTTRATPASRFRRSRRSSLLWLRRGCCRARGSTRTRSRS